MPSYAVEARARGRRRATDARYGEIIGKMIAWQATGMSYAEIARELNRQGYRTNKGREWYPSMVRGLSLVRQ